MKSRRFALSLLLLAAPAISYAAEQLIPAGALVKCTVSEPKLSSKTAAVGDPVLCKVSHVEMYGRATFPYGSYMVGRFEDYKDPGHLVGKGWMELKFDRLILQPDISIPIDARVVHVPGYPVDREGRIQGKGHPVRDTVEWMIPVLWPLDLINLPRRGPRPVLKEETRLTLKIMDDIGVPIPQQQQSPYDQQPGLLRRPTTSYAPQSEAPLPQEQQAPTYASAPPPQSPGYDEQPSQTTYGPEPETYAPQPVYAYAPPPQPAAYVYGPPPVPRSLIYRYAPPAFYAAPVNYGYIAPPPAYYAAPPLIAIRRVVPRPVYMVPGVYP